MVTKKSPDSTNKTFLCEYCDYECCKNSEYIKHLLTRKHIGNASGNKKKSETKYYCDTCNKMYKSRKGLWGHNKVCTNKIVQNESINITITDHSETEVKSLTTLVVELIKSNQDLQKQMIEVCKNSNTTNNTTNTNSHNKNFNLNFFLNEQCKDAMNIMDFVNTFQLQFSDFEKIGEVGYVQGISNIIIDKLNEMDIYKRPIHCSDAKRETMHIKDNNVWSKDTANNDKLRLAIKYISKKNSDMVRPWLVKHPGALYSDHHLSDAYQMMIIESMGGNSGTLAECETKIIKKISKMVLIDKRM